MRVRFIIAVFSAFLISALTGYGQQIKILIDSVNYDEDNVLFNNGIDSVITYLHVTDSANTPVSVSGNIRYWVQSDTMIILGEPPVLIDDNPASENVTVSGFTDSLLIPLDSLTLRTGPANVIIIWPSMVSPGRPLMDSGFAPITVYIFEGMGIEQETYKFGSTVFPNPSQGIQMIHIQSKHTQPIQYIDIVNMLGQPIYSKTYNHDEQGSGYLLPLAAYESGVYYLHIYYTDGKHETIKFIKN